VTDPDEPPTVEWRTEWSVHLVGSLGVFGKEHTFSSLESEHHARSRLIWWRERRPDVQSELLCREVEVRRGPWRPVE
jgi:hypothetical protein